LKRWAIISNCAQYRPMLGRATDAWNLPMPFICWALNNPSKADANEDDPTVNKLWRYTLDWGYQCMTLVNTNPYRATNPMAAMIPPEGTLSVNDLYLINEASAAAMIICAWGDKADKALARRALATLAPIKPLYAMRITKAGNPQHPLYLPGDTKPQLWSPERWLH
jgi:hypothetical protein